jgi:hypothetical protein
MESLEHRRLLSGSVTGSDPEPLALLVPAVQKVREAAARTQEVADLQSVPETARIGLLLPAVQKVS